MTGVAPSIGYLIAERLGVECKLLPFPSPPALCAAAETHAWDIALVGADPDRSQNIAFTPAYCEIEATYLVRAES